MAFATYTLLIVAATLLAGRAIWDIPQYKPAGMTIPTKLELSGMTVPMEMDTVSEPGLVLKSDLVQETAIEKPEIDTVLGESPVLEPLGQSRVIRLGRRRKGPMYLAESFMVDGEEVVSQTQIDQMGFPLKGIKPTWYVGSLEEVVKHLFA